MVSRDAPEGILQTCGLALALLLGGPSFSFAQETPALEDHLAKIEAGIAGVRKSDRETFDAVTQTCAHFRPWRIGDSDLDAQAGAGFKARLDEATLRHFLNAWIDSPVQEQMKDKFRSGTAAYQQAQERLGDKEDPGSRKALLSARLRAEQAELDYFNARKIFMERRYRGLLNDFWIEMGSSLAQARVAAALKLTERVMKEIDALDRARGWQDFMKGLEEMGVTSVNGAPAEVFRASLKEIWVQAAAAELGVPRYYANALHKRLLAPGGPEETSFQNAAQGKFQDFLRELLSEKITRGLGDRARVNARAQSALKRLGADKTWQELLADDDIGGLLEGYVAKGRIDQRRLQSAVANNLADPDGKRLDGLREQAGVFQDVNEGSGSFWELKHLKDLTAAVAAKFAASGVAVSNGSGRDAPRLAVDAFHELEAWLGSHPELGIDPRQESMKPWALDAALDNPERWRQEAGAYERARALEERWSLREDIAPKDIEQAWLAVLQVRGEDKAWPPFRDAAMDRISGWKNVKEKSGPRIYWDKEVVRSRNGKASDAILYDHGDSIAVSARYRVKGIELKQAVDVEEKTSIGDEKPRLRTRRLKEDGMYAVERTFQIPPDTAPGVHAARFSVGPAGEATPLSAGFTVSNLYPDLAARLDGAQGRLGACGLSAAAGDLASLAQEAEAQKSRNRLFAQLDGRIESSLREARSAQSVYADVDHEFRQAQQDALSECRWPQALRHAAKARSLLKKLPPACSRDLSALGAIESRAQSYSDALDAEERYVVAGDKATDACNFDSAAEAYATAEESFNGVLAAAVCPKPAAVAKLARAKGVNAEEMLKVQKDVAAALQTAKESSERGDSAQAIQSSNRALGLVLRANPNAKACLRKSRQDAVAIAVGAGRDLPVPDPDQAAGWLPPDDADQRAGRLVAKHGQYLTDQQRRQEEAQRAAQAAPQADAQDSAAAAESGAAFGRALGAILLGAPAEPDGSGRPQTDRTVDEGIPAGRK